ncbi:MAG: ribonuclease H-like domain-containing protein [Acidobacteriota bacterium]
MSCTVIDIETVGQPLTSFPERFHEQMLNWFDPGPADTAMDEGRRTEAERRFSLWGPTGRVIVIGMHNPDTEKSRVLAGEDERALLREFWDLVRSFQMQVTFNGKQFDFPFLLMRSAVLGITPTVRLDCRRFSRHPHYDVREMLTHFYLNRHGSLDFFCELFGIPSPKTGLSGAQVGEAFAAGRLDEIAAYCEADIVATAALYRRIKDVF